MPLSCSRILCCLLCLLSSPLILGQGAPERVGDFALLDSDGMFHQLSRYRHREALVLIPVSSGCPATRTLMSQVESLSADWEDLGGSAALLAVQGEAFLAGEGALADLPDVPLLLDKGRLVAEALGVTRAGEALILDPHSLTLRFRGNPDEVAVRLGGGEPESLAVSLPRPGCEIDYPARVAHRESPPDYASEVAPIVVEQCSDCHREGGIGPFALNSHLMLAGWAPMIREVLMTRRMPPMQVDPRVGHFDNANTLSAEDMQTLLHWIDAGAPRGTGPEDPLRGLNHPDMKSWRLGQPDYIIKAPAHQVPATGVLDYINVDIALPFTEDKWVRAVQYIPGDEAVLHHLLTYVTPPGGRFQGEASPLPVAQRFLEGYAPGKVDPIRFPAGTGVKIPAGHQLSMQFHYTTNGRETVDETLLGLYLYDEAPPHENFTRSVAGLFRVPPHARQHDVAASHLFQEEVVVTGLRAHMHFRGKFMRFAAEYPDGRRQELLNVPNYSYAWQPTYQLSEPLRLPAGTRVHVTGAFDNSEHNPANPDPNKELTFGLQSWDEMFIGYWTYHPAGPEE